MSRPQKIALWGGLVVCALGLMIGKKSPHATPSYEFLAVKTAHSTAHTKPRLPATDPSDQTHNGDSRRTHNTAVSAHLQQDRAHHQEQLPETASDFRAFLAQTLHEVASTNREFQRLRPAQRTQALHHQPPASALAGQRLGVIAHTLTKHTDWAPEAQDFYLNCAQAADFPTAARALCWANYSRLHRETAGSTAELHSLSMALPPTVARLARHIPN